MAFRPFHQRVPDFKTHRFQFAAQLMIPKAQHLDALRCEKLVSPFISGSLVWKTVSAAIEFNGQLCQRAVEIEEENAAGILPAEFEFGETPVAQQTPQTFFGVSGFFAEMAGKIAGGGGAGAMFAIVRKLPPHPGPLPRWGRG